MACGVTGKRWDQVIYYQYRHDGARRTLRGIDEQTAKAEKAIAGKTETDLTERNVVCSAAEVAAPVRTARDAREVRRSANNPATHGCGRQRPYRFCTVSLTATVAATTAAVGALAQP